MKLYGETKLAIVGATGLVGGHLLQILGERGHIPADLSLFASERTAGRKIVFGGNEHTVERLGMDAVERGCDIAIFAAGSAVSREWAPKFAARGTIVVDKSSAWRQDIDCPLVVPQVNPGSMKNIPKGIIASPNCSTTGLVLAIKPLIDVFGPPKHIVVATYQAVSGAGIEGVRALGDQRRGVDYPGPFGKPIYDNVLPVIGEIDDSLFCTEEAKLINETRRILGLSEMPITATAVRVPIEICHSEAVTLLFERDIDLQLARSALIDAAEIRFVVDDDYPTPLDVAGSDRIFIGRLRITPAAEGALSLFLCFDNLRRGAATNAIDIVERLLETMS